MGLVEDHIWAPPDQRPARAGTPCGRQVKVELEGELKYLAPHEIPTRDQELQNIKTEELIKRDASGHLRAHDEAKIPDADARTDLRLRQAYTRRGLALEIADAMTFTVHEKLVDKLFQEYEREPPAGYSQVILSQVTAADRRAWKLMSEQIQGDLGRNPAGRRLAGPGAGDSLSFCCRCRGPCKWGEGSYQREPAAGTRADRCWQEEAHEGEPEIEGAAEEGRDQEEEAGDLAARRGQNGGPQEDADQDAEGVVGPDAHKAGRTRLLRLQHGYLITCKPKMGSARRGCAFVCAAGSRVMQQ